MAFLALFLLVLTGFMGITTAADKSAKSKSASPLTFDLLDGDRLVLLGDTLIEREQYHGYIELALTARFPDRSIAFRNLGWSGDTPAGEARLGRSKLQAGLEPEGESWKLLVEQVTEEKPTVVFLGYGMAASFDGEAGLAKFTTNLGKLVDEVQKSAGEKKIRFVVLSPIRHENLGAPLPDPAAHNEQLALYAQALGEFASQRGFPFISLFDSVVPDSKKRVVSKPITDNGIHLTAQGYQKAAEAIEKGLGWKPNPKLFTTPAAEPLRQAILRKNEAFFHRSRPANMAYIFGFRRHEQGKNAAEIPQFDSVIAAEEANIAKLRGLTAGVAVEPAATRIKSAVPPAVKTQPLPSFAVFPGMEVNLFAENPQLAKPIQMNFDPQGRLWVVSSSVYPQIEPGQKADDKVLILEDVDGDGKAEKATVFVDGLIVPTAVAPGDGGVYVGNSTELLHFKDTNGDGKADQRRVVLSGFGTEDTHHIIHTLRWGQDSHLYFNQSIYNRTHIETPHGVTRLLSGGIFRLHTGTLELGVLYKGWVNSWGHHFDKFGQSFVTDGAGFGGVSYGIPGAMYQAYARGRRIMESISPGNYPKFCGLEITETQHFPDTWQGWQGDLITCDFRANRVVRFRVEEKGAGYLTKEAPDMMRTTNNTFRPIDVKLGPDGALYVADWANPIIQHGEVDFRDPRRDHEHGRIWRIAFKDNPLNQRIDFTKLSNPALLDQLSSSNNYDRAMSRRVLVERNALKDVNSWVKKQSSKTLLLEALWLYQAFNHVEPKILSQVLDSNDGRIRAAAVRVLSDWIGGISNAQELLAGLVVDEHPRVRLEAMRALSKIPDARSVELVLSAYDKPMDGFLDYALWLSINDLAQPFIAALQSGEWKPDGREKQLEFALKSIEPALASTVLGKLVAGQPIARDGKGPWIEIIGQSGSAKELRQLFDQVLAEGFIPAAAERALTALAEAARLRNARPDGDLNGLGKVLNAVDVKTRIAAMRLAGTWKLNSASAALLKVAGNANLNPELRQAAFDALRDIGGQSNVAGLGALTGKDNDPSIRRAAVVTLASLGVGRAAPEMVAVLSATTTEADALALWRALLGIRGAGTAIAKGVPKGGLPEVPAKTGLRVAREGGRNEPELILALSRSASIGDEQKNLSAAELQALADNAMKQGSPERGEKIYRRAALGCVSCHAIGGAGGKVGPDMTSIGASAPVDYLVESILFPNRKIKEGFHSLMVETKDEQEFSGILVRETDTELVLRNAANQEVSIAKSNISKRNNGMSLMPSGLVDALSQAERLDLFRFLSQLGKPGNYDAAAGGVARVWRLQGGAHTLEQFGIDKVVTGDIQGKDWQPAYTLVDGRLLKDEILETGNVARNRSLVSVFAATQFQVAKSGPVQMKLEASTGSAVWIDGKPIDGNSNLKTDLAAGTHTIIIRLDARQIPDGLRLKSADVTFATN
jgi:putative heme-binding domain-containing protein